MPSHAPDRPKLFTLAQANATLPLVRAIVTDMVRLARDVEERRQRLALLAAGKPGGAHTLYRDELQQMEQELERDTEQILDYGRELQALGAEPKDALTGLVDFPCRVDGRVVYLCWKLGEGAIGFWHEIEAGFAGRQPLSTAGLGGDAANN
jgi:hypothetical protein